MCIRFCYIILALTLSANSFGKGFSSFVLQFAAYSLPEGIDITVISNEDDFIKIKGTSKSKLKTYEYAKDLLFDERLLRFDITDVIPLSDDGSFSLIIKLRDYKKKEKASLTFDSPSPRENLKGSVTLKGRCPGEGREVLISGDIVGKSRCLYGVWEYRISSIGQKTSPIIAVTVSQRLIDKGVIKDYRSFQTNL